MKTWIETLPGPPPEHDVDHVVLIGWQGTKNGALLAKIAEAGYQVLITVDKNLRHQQNLKGRPFALIVLDIHPITFEFQRACAPMIEETLAVLEPGNVYVIEGPHSRRGP